VEPTLLHPPSPGSLDVAVTDGGDLQVALQAIPLADTYRVSVLTHPAGLENRIAGGMTVELQPDPDCLTGEGPCGPVKGEVPLFGLGNGLVWVAVESRRADLLAFGATVAGPFSVQDGPAESTEAVLDCETLSTVVFESVLPQPNDAAGQSYVRLVPSFLGAGAGSALELEFVPSSLGFVKKGGAGEVAVLVGLVEPLQLAAGEALGMAVVPGFSMDTSGKLVASTQFIRVEATGIGGSVVAEWDLADSALQPGAAASVMLQAEQPLAIHGLRFALPLSTPGLPMDQVLQLTLDDLHPVP
jgi:hypothetical protein